ncbi:MAG: asparagine synthase (glutamine-hydrolyzing) [Byssovorax sp.]
MCGIAGIYNFRDGRPPRRDDLDRMAQPMLHRGPDGEGRFIDGALGLAHRRLSIIDLESGAQPMIGQSGCAVVFNGEIYNYAALFTELEASGLRARTRSDTEALLLAYERWGLDFVHHLTGMFAFALWDPREELLVLGRDRLGIKPLYLAHTPGGLAFASEIKALFGVTGIDTSIDLESLDEFMSVGYVTQPRSLVRGIRKVEPGTLVTVTPAGKITERRYFSLDFSPDPLPSEREWADALRALFDEVTRDHLRSDVPFGVLLSGGIDSTIVAATAAKSIRPAPLDSFCIGVDLPGEAHDLDWARQVSRVLGTRHHERRLGADDLTALIRAAVASVDEPIADPVCAQLFGVCRLARDEGIKVLLSGEGADELFFGYGAYPKMHAIERAQRLVPQAALDRFIAPVFRAAADCLGRLPRVATYLKLGGSAIEQRYLGVNLFDPTLKHRLYRADVREALADFEVSDTLRRFYDGAGGEELLSRMAAFDCRTWLVDNILYRSDLMSMAASIELRVPFLDHRLVELAQRIPARHKVQGSTGKVVLRRAFADRIPSEVLRRPKLGFPTPVHAMFRRSFGHEAEETLTSRSAITSTYFDPSAVRALFNEHRRGVDQGRVLYQLYALESWGRATRARSIPPAAVEASA